MRGASSKDGKLSGNVQTVGRYNDTKQGGRGAERRPDKGGGHSGGLHEFGGDDSAKPVESIVSEHGPAEYHEIAKHGQEYKSMTRHADGHEHEATHGSLEEAHDHGKQAMEDTDSNNFNQDQQHVAEQRDRGEAHHSKKENISFME